MEPSNVTKAVGDVLRDIQAKQNLKCPPLNDTSRPIRDLEKFDSPMSIGVTGMIGRKLGIAIPPEINIFGDKDGAYTIKKTVGLLCKLADSEKQLASAEA